MSVHRSESWHEQSRMGTFLRTGPRLHETSSSIISDRSKVVNFAGSWRYLTPLLSLSLFTRATGSRCFDFRQSTTWKATSICRNPRSFRPRNERWSRALVPVSFYLLSLERIYRLPIKRLRLMGHR